MDKPVKPDLLPPGKCVWCHHKTASRRRVWRYTVANETVEEVRACNTDHALRYFSERLDAPGLYPRSN